MTGDVTGGGGGDMCYAQACSMLQRPLFGIAVLYGVAWLMARVFREILGFLSRLNNDNVITLNPTFVSRYIRGRTIKKGHIRLIKYGRQAINRIIEYC
jgi:hypothetical protein